MKAILIDSKRANINTVTATYSFDGTEFTVEWSNSDGDYDLMLETKSQDKDLAARVDDAIRIGESDSNPDLELYLSILEAFDRGDCIAAHTPYFEILNKEETTASDMGLDEQALTELGGCSDYGDSLGLGAWQYDFEVKVLNQSGEVEAFTVVFQPEERCNGMKAYSGYDLEFGSCDADESQELIEFCDYDETVTDALHEIAKSAAIEAFEALTTEL